MGPLRDLRWGCAAWGVAIVVSVHGGRSQAQSAIAEAEASFRQGKELMAANRVAEACAAFDLSEKLDPRTTTLLNQANCRERNDQLATAWALFLEAVRQLRTASDAASQQLRSVASDRAARLERRLSTLRVDVPAENNVPGLQVFRDGQVSDPNAWNRPLPLDGGHYRISARAPGTVEWSTIVTVAVEGEAKQIMIPRLAPATGEQHAVPRSDSAAAVSQPTASLPQTTSGMWTSKRKLAAGLAGAGAVALAVGAVLGTSASSKRDEAHALCPVAQACDGADRANDLIRSAHNLAFGADVAFGVTAAAAIAAGTLWFTGAPESQRGVVVVPALGPRQIALTASGSF